MTPLLGLMVVALPSTALAAQYPTVTVEDTIVSVELRPYRLDGYIHRRQRRSLTTHHLGQRVQRYQPRQLPAR